MRLDTYLQEEIARTTGVKLSRSYIERLLEGGGVTYNDEVIKKKGFSFDAEKQKPAINAEKLANLLSVYQTGKRQDNEADAWDASEMGIELDEYRVKKAADIRPQIVFENDDILAVNKPQGVSSHPGRGDRGADSMVYQFIKYMREAHQYIPRAGLLHRLDKDTQGILLFAKNMQAYNEVKVQFEKRTLQKYYVAICEKTPQMNINIKKQLQYLQSKELKQIADHEDMSQLITSVMGMQKPIQLRGVIGRRKGTPYMVYAPDESKAGKLIGIKDCHTDVYVISESEYEIEFLMVPHTGRTHQLRAQARYLGASVKNDRMYGLSDTQEGTLKLCAAAIEFKNKGDELKIALPVAKIFSN